MIDPTEEDIEVAMSCASSHVEHFWAELPIEMRTRGVLSCFFTFCMAEYLLWHTDDKYDVLGEIFDEVVKEGGEGDDKMVELKFEEWQMQRIHLLQTSFMKDERVRKIIDGLFQKLEV